MTDKQIIIDGVDVSGCIYFKKNNKMSMCRACNSGVGTPYCEYHKDSYYKQLKRKERECEKINLTNERLVAEKYIMNEEILKLKAKEQECEELKKANDGILTTIRILAKNNIKLREILAEIKDVAEASIRIADLEGLNGVYRRGLAKQILQKISEI